MYEQATVDLPAPLPTDGAEPFTYDHTFRQMSPSTSFEGLEQINWVSDQRNLERISEKLFHNDMRPSANWTPQPPTFIRDEKTHPKLYTVKREESNMDNNFGH